MVLAPVVMQAQREKLPPKDYEWAMQNFPNAKKTSTGLRYVEIEKGSGDLIKRGDNVSVLYTGRFISGETFDEQWDPKKPLEFRVGRSRVIRGWDYILQKMRLGDKWLVIVPSELGYGTKGKPPSIPANVTLVFTMQVIAVEHE